MPDIQKVVCGLDPGLDGALCLMMLGKNAEPEKLLVETMFTKMGPKNKRDVDAARLVSYLQTYFPSSNSKYECCGIAVEIVHSMPAQGISSAFTFGKGYGKILAAIEIMGLPIYDVTPQRWKKQVLDGLTHDKDGAIRYCTNMFPKTDLKATPKCKKPHDGICDAICMAEYLRRILFITDRTKP